MFRMFNLVIIAVVVVTCFCLISCGSDDSSTSPSTQVDLSNTSNFVKCLEGNWEVYIAYRKNIQGKIDTSLKPMGGLYNLTLSDVDSTIVKFKYLDDIIGVEGMIVLDSFKIKKSTKGNSYYRFDPLSSYSQYYIDFNQMSKSIEQRGEILGGDIYSATIQMAKKSK